MNASNPFALGDMVQEWQDYCAPNPFDGPRVLRFFVPGTAKPKGSKSYKGKRRNGSAILVESADVAPWQSEVARVARATGVRFTGPVGVSVEFILRRPAHPKYPEPAVKPDGDKLERAVWDALTEAGVIEDDSRVVSWTGLKRYARGDGHPGVAVSVWSRERLTSPVWRDVGTGC